MHYISWYDYDYDMRAFDSWIEDEPVVLEYDSLYLEEPTNTVPILTIILIYSFIVYYHILSIF